MNRIYILIFLAMVVSCNEETPENQPPECKITTPVNDNIFQFREIISIIIEATDTDGLIDEIQLYFGGTGITSLKDFPYTYSIETVNYVPGEYAIKATAIDNGGLKSSDEIQIIISGLLPTIITDTVTDVSVSSALSGGTVEDDGGEEIIARGVCWGTSLEPTINGNHTSDGNGVGSFVSSVTGLEPETTYYLRAYATNSVGTSYGNERSFETRVTVTDYDGNVYQTVKIGNQLWMAESLRTTYFADGTEISHVEGMSDWEALPMTGTAAYCWYNKNISNGDIYGALYTWDAAVKGEVIDTDALKGVQGVCPNGWHLPSNAEWTELINFLGGEEVAGGKMKDSKLWTSPNTGGTNVSGFSGLPSGTRRNDGTFANIGTFGFYWSANPTESDWYAYNRRLNYNNTEARYQAIYKKDGASVRCIRD
jgi:uncharacterized protein (TIGR02145 family)